MNTRKGTTYFIIGKRDTLIFESKRGFGVRPYRSGKRGGGYEKLPHRCGRSAERSFQLPHRYGS